MAFVVQMDSNFNGLKSDLNGYSDAINNAQMKILEVIESDLNGFSAVNLGGWNDQLAQNLTTYCNDVKSGLTNVQSDVSGVCNCFNAILSDLSSGLTDCQKYRSRINNYSDRLRFINDDTKREKIVAALNAEQRNLSNCVSYCNSLASQFSQYEFNGNINTYTSSQISGLENTDDLYQASLGDADGNDSNESAPESQTPKQYYTSDGQRYHMEGTGKGLYNVLVLTDTDTGYIYDGWTSGAVGRDLFFSSDQSEGYAIVDGNPVHFRKGSDGYYYYDNGVSIRDNPNG